MMSPKWRWRLRDYLLSPERYGAEIRWGGQSLAPAERLN